MSEAQDLKLARELIAESKKDEASKILWKLYESRNPKMKLDAILGLLVTLDHFTENMKLLRITEEGLKIASSLAGEDTATYLLVEKCNFLNTQFGFMLYRQKNLKMAANVFKWIDFATEREKREFEALNQKRKEIEHEIQNLENRVLNSVKNSENHYFKGNIYLRFGKLYGSKFFHEQLNSMIGGKTRSMIGNVYFVRRWNLGKWFLYRKQGRKRINDCWAKCVNFLESAISEFRAGGYNGEMAHAYYNLAVKHGLAFGFKKAKIFLEQADKLARENNEKALIPKIELYRQQLVNKNRNIRDYVGEYGLDLP